MGRLSHWNLLDELTGHQAAALAAGIEPKAGKPTPEYDALVAAMEAAYKLATRWILDALLRVYESHHPASHDVVTIDPRRGQFSWDAVVSVMSDDDDDARRKFARMLVGKFAALPPTTREVGMMRARQDEIRALSQPDGLVSVGLRNALLGAQADGDVEFALLTLAALPAFNAAYFDRERLTRWFDTKRDRFTSRYDFSRTEAAEAGGDGAAAEEKPLTTTERNTLLRILAVLAVRGYGIDPRASRIEKLGEVQRDAEALGLSISDDTLRAKLREAFAMIEDSRTTAR